jgi:N12 class adenine-specific DNA methylase
VTTTFPDDIEVSGDVPDDLTALEWKSLPAGETSSPLTGVIDHNDADGTITALVAVTGVKDSVGDVIVPGSADKAVKRLKPKGVMSHNWGDRVSRLIWHKELMPGDSMLPKQTPQGDPWPANAGGLLIKAKYNLDKQSGRDAYADAKFYGADECFSIGYKVRPGGSRMRGATRYLHDYDLYEWSQVLHGAHPLATLTGVKSLADTVEAPWYDGTRSGDIEGDTALPDGVETKVRVVRDADFWHLPIGTPIKPGMVPHGLNRPPTEQEIHATTADAGDDNGLHGAPDAVATPGMPGAPAPGGLGMPPMPDMALPIPGPKDGDAPTGDPDAAVALLRTRVGEIEKLNTPAARTASAALTPFLVPGAPVRASEDGQLVAVHTGDAWRFADTANGGVMQVTLPGTLPQPNVDMVLHELAGVGIPWDSVDARRKRWENPSQLQADKATVAGIFARAGTPPTTTPPGIGGAGMGTPPPPGVPGAPGAGQGAPGAPPATPGMPNASVGAPPSIPATPAPAPNVPTAPPTPTVPATPPVSPKKFPRGSIKGHGIAPGDRIRVHGHPRGTLEGTVESGKNGHSIVHDDGSKTWLGGTGSRHHVEKLGKAADQPPKLATASAAPPASKPAPERKLAFARFDRIENVHDLPGAIRSAILKPDTLDNPARRQALAVALHSLTEPTAPNKPPAKAHVPDDVDPAALADELDGLAQEIEDRGKGRIAITPAHRGSGRTVVADLRALAAGIRTPAASAPESAKPPAPVVPEPYKPTGNINAPHELTDEQLATEAAHAATRHARARASGVPKTSVEHHDSKLANTVFQDEIRRRAVGGESGVKPAPKPGPPAAPETPAVPDKTGEVPEDAPDTTVPLPQEAVDSADRIRAEALGIIDGPDGQEEVTPEVADRQDRVEGYLVAGEAALADKTDGQLSETRKDLTDELALQDELNRRDTQRRKESAAARSSRSSSTADPVRSGDTPGATGDGTPEDTGPKLRPGFAGAAEDLGDALNAKPRDDETVKAAADRFAKMLRRHGDSTSFDAVRTAIGDDIHAAIASGDLKAGMLFTAAGGVREQRRVARNEGAKKRRLAKRLDRDRIKALIGSVDAEVRARKDRGSGAAAPKPSPAPSVAASPKTGQGITATAQHNADGGVHYLVTHPDGSYTTARYNSTGPRRTHASTVDRGPGLKPNSGGRYITSIHSSEESADQSHDAFPNVPHIVTPIEHIGETGKAETPVVPEASGPRADAEQAIRDGDRIALVDALKAMGDTGPRETAMRLLSLSEDDAITELDDHPGKRETANRADRHAAAQVANAAGDSAALTAALTGEHRKPDNALDSRDAAAARERAAAKRAAVKPAVVVADGPSRRAEFDASTAEDFPPNTPVRLFQDWDREHARPDLASDVTAVRRARNGYVTVRESKGTTVDVFPRQLEKRDQGAQSPQKDGGDDAQRASDTSRSVVPEVPAADLRGDSRQTEVLPGPGRPSPGADHPGRGPVGGPGPTGGDIPGQTGAPDSGTTRRDGTGDEGLPGSPTAPELDGQSPAEPAEPGPVDASREDGPVGGRDGGLRERERGTGSTEPGDEAAGTADTAPAPEPDSADGVTAEQPEADTGQVDAIPDTGESFHPSSADDFAPAGKRAKLDANLAALRVLRQLQTEHRSATPEEQSVLARWAGWGGLPEVFDDKKTAYAKERDELRGLLSGGEWNEAKRNTLNAHYTSPVVVQALWKAMGDLGFDGGRVLEPGSGSGTFIGYAPEGADMVGVELDSTTAAISRALYPHATVRNESFADTRLPAGSFDATIGNVPFGDFALRDRVHNPNRAESIHNHFILKSLALTKPGGIVTVLTSRYTLDGENPRARKKMAEMGDLLGAVRLPTGSHSKTSGTDVIEDALIFRRREPGADPLTPQDWINSSKRDIDGIEIPVNDYFTAHPDQVLGDEHAEKGQYGSGSLIVTGDKAMPELPAALARITDGANTAGATASARMEGLADFTAPDDTRHDGHIAAHDDGSFTQASQGAAVPFAVPEKQAEELRGLIGMRDTLSTLLTAESQSVSNSPEIRELRKTLNDQYDAYVKRYGPINRYTLTKSGARNAPGQGGFRRDPMSAIVRALEIYNPETGKAVKTDIFTKRSVSPREIPTHADNPEDALALSLDTYGEVNLGEIAKMLHTDEATARRRLGDLIFEQPPLTDDELDKSWTAHQEDHGGIPDQDIAAGTVDLSSVGESVRAEGNLEPAAAYLSGNVRRKLAAAEAAAAHDPRFQTNVDALKKVIPADLGVDEVDGRLGAAWIPADDVKTFMIDLLHGGDNRYNPVQVSTSGGGIWTVVGGDHGNVATEQWGTKRKSAGELIAAMLEQKPIRVVDTIDGKSYPNLEETLAAQAKADEISERFSEWLFEDSARTKRLLAAYNNQFNAVRLRSYDGVDRVFPGMTSSGWKPRAHQVAAVNRIVSEPCALLAHVVGAGKTAEMAMGAAELKRLRMARKPAIVVPSHMLEQFTREYLQIYPRAKILAAGTEDLDGDKRREFVARAATGQWDCVILTKDAMQLIPMSQDAQKAYIDREMATMRAQLEAAQGSGGDAAHQATVKKMEKAVIKAEEALKAKLEKTKDAGVSFEQTGIDYLFVDEAHQYSNLRTVSNIQGAGASGSGIATDLHMKIEHLRANNESGRVATFATGTPIRNTVTQAYIMQRFMRPDLLKEAGVHSFDQWAATFGQTVDEMELKPEGTGFRQTTRFAKFRNVPELLRLFQIFADVKTAEDLNLPTPDLAGGSVDNVVVPSTDELRETMAELAHRADQYRAGSPEKRTNAAGTGEVDDMMLLISMDGRKAAMRQSDKLDMAAEKIADIWGKNKNKPIPKDLDDPTAGDDPPPGGMQIVFCDMFTPKGGAKSDVEQRTEYDDGDNFDAYAALRAKLADRGMDPKRIRFMHEAKNDRQKAELFAAARNGGLDVLVGSTEKMGVGTNVQRRAVALHHLDAPWRPSDLEQRDGRIMRQGNANDEVSIHRYVTEGSFDAYMWQTLERKKKFIDQIMGGSLDQREIEDVGETALSYAEVKALATGNPLLLQKATVDTAIGKLSRLERTHNRTQTNLRRDVVAFRANAEASDAYVKKMDAAVKARTDITGDNFAMTVHGTTTRDRGEAASMLKAAVEDVIRNDYGYGKRAKPVAEFGGHKLMATVEDHYDRNGARRRGVTLTWDGVPGGASGGNATAASISYQQLASGGIGQGTLATLAHSLHSFESHRDISADHATRLRSEADVMEARVGTEFPHAGALKTARDESARLKATMEASGIREDAGPGESDAAKNLATARTKAAGQAARMGRSGGNAATTLKRFGNSTATPGAVASPNGAVGAYMHNGDFKVFLTDDGVDVRDLAGISSDDLKGVVKDPQGLVDDLAKLDLPFDEGARSLYRRWNGDYSYSPPDYSKSYEEREAIAQAKRDKLKAGETADKNAIKAVFARHLTDAPVEPELTGVDAAKRAAARAAENDRIGDLAKKRLKRFAKASKRIPHYASPDGKIGAVTDTDGGLEFFATGNGMLLNAPGSVGPVDDPQAVVDEIAALGVPLGDSEVRYERWGRGDGQQNEDVTAIRGILTRHADLMGEKSAIIGAWELLRAQRLDIEVKARADRAAGEVTPTPDPELEPFTVLVADDVRYTMDASGTLQRLMPCPACGQEMMVPAFGESETPPCPSCGAVPTVDKRRAPVG